MSKIGAIILAAGPSTRMGKPKQLLKVEGETLIQRTVNTALRVCDYTVTVLGANYHLIHNHVRYLRTHSVFNLDWNKGMGTSIKLGLHELNSLKPGLDGVIFLACDQPAITAGLLRKMIDAHESGSAIVIASCNDQISTPILIDRKYFKEILKMDDLDCPPPFLRDHNILFLPFPQGNADIDTPEDWKSFRYH